MRHQAVYVEVWDAHSLLQVGARLAAAHAFPAIVLRAPSTLTGVLFRSYGEPPACL